MFLLVHQPPKSRRGNRRARVRRVSSCISTRKGFPRYREVCGFPDNGLVPVTYPHVLAFPQIMGLLFKSGPLIGIIHVRHAIAAMRPIRETENLAIDVWLNDSRTTERGREREIAARASVDGVEVWRETAVFLKPTARARQSGAHAPERPEGQMLVIPANIGRRYAWAAGDWNPIHLWPLTARLFGHPRAMAHGMWSLARCTAEMDFFAGSIEARFQRPLFLPGQATLTRTGGGCSLRDASTGAPHLTAEFTEA